MVEYDFVKIPIVDIVNQIILYAAQHRASDIHFDPLEDALMIRMRIDGTLRNHSVVPKIYERNLITRIKLVAAMNITETRLPQDGAIKGRIAGKDLDMRVSILPTNEGEKCVIRILDFDKSLGGLDTLGFSRHNLEKIKKMLNIPNGIILVTGATGSGKSTTTYSMLQTLNREDTNIITVEDPIEMNIEGVNQVQVNSEIGMTFAAALRSILRQDPNIILIGEMRDEETAQIAVRASITGHLVLSTIHTNNALATIERLIDMGVERYMLATSVTGIISQRLARTLCDKCKRLRPTTKYERYMFAKVLRKKVKQVYEPVGCEECHNGYKGRTAIQEVLYISEHLRDLISDISIDKENLRAEVYGAGETTTLLQDALQKVLEGITSFKEIYRVVDIDIDLDNAIRSQMGIKDEDEEEDEDDDEIIDFETFDGVYDDELDVINGNSHDEDGLPQFDKSIINTKPLEQEFNKNLDDSDPKFVHFIILEDRHLQLEEIKKEKLAELKRIENERKRIDEDRLLEVIDINTEADKTLEESRIRIEKELEELLQREKELDDEIKAESQIETEIKKELDDNHDKSQLKMKDNKYSSKDDANLNSNDFDFKEIIDLIDTYSNADINEDDNNIKPKKKKKKASEDK